MKGYEEISGDITLTHRLSGKEKFSYLYNNLMRGIAGYSSGPSIRFIPLDTKAQGSDSPGRHYLNTYVRTVLPQMLPPGRIRVLDIGCGTGYIRALLAESGYSGQYDGLDIEKEERFDQNGVPEFVSTFIQKPIGDLTPEPKYDLVLSNTSFEHIPDDAEAGRIAHDALAPQGVGMHLYPSFWSLFMYLFHGYRQYTPVRIAHAFKGQNFKTHRIGGAASFLLHVCVITIPERVLGMRSVRASSWYPRMVRAANTLDRYLPFCSMTYATIVRKNLEPKRVLFALPSLLIGGIENQLVKQLHLYDRTKFKLGLVTLFSYSNRPDFFSQLPSDVTVYQAGFKSALDVKAVRGLIRFLTEWHPDLVVSSMFSANTLFRVLKPLLGYRSIAREHNIYDEKTLVQKGIDRILSGVSCTIIAVSKGVAQYAARQAAIPASRFTVIQNGVDVDRLQSWQAAHPRNTLREELGFKENEIVFLTIGRLKKTKNQAALIRAFARLNDSAARLVVIGSGIEKTELTTLVDELGSTNIQLLERHGEEVYPFYAAADCFILPSLREGFPNVMLEAMSFGLPVVGTQVAGSEECISEGENGFFITETSEQAIHEALVRFVTLDSKTRSDMGVASRARVQQYSLTNVVTRYEECFEACLEKN